MYTPTSPDQHCVTQQVEHYKAQTFIFFEECTNFYFVTENKMEKKKQLLLIEKP